MAISDGNLAPCHAQRHAHASLQTRPKHCIHCAAAWHRTSSCLKSKPTESEIIDWCVAYLAKSLNLKPDRIDPQAKFARLGMDSAASVFLVSDLEDWLGLDLSVEMLFEHQTPAALARYLAARCAKLQSAAG